MISISRSVRIACLLSAGLAACSEQGIVRPNDPRLMAKPDIRDGAHGGNEHFFFLPPLVSAPAVSGTSDGSLSPTIEVCDMGLAAPTALDSCAGKPIIAQFSNAISYDATAEQYHVNWHTDQTAGGTVAGHFYRIRVLVETAPLGHIDVQAVSSGKELKNVETNQYIGLVDGRTLPIKFRIEQGALAVVGPNGGDVELAEGKVGVKVPAGATEENITLAAIPLATGEHPADPALVAGSVYEVTPSVSFDAPILVTVSYDPSQLPVGVLERDLRLYHYVNGAWEYDPGSSVDLVAKTVTGRTMSFSPIAAGGRKEQIVFASSRGGFSTTQWDVYIMEATGSTATLIATSPLSDKAPALSPNGSMVAFESQRSGRFQVHVVDLTPSGVPAITRQLTTSAGSSGAPAWTPDGRIVFNESAGSESHLWIMDSLGNGKQQLTFGPFQDGLPNVSADGSTVVFTRWVNGKPCIFSVPLAGGTPTQLTFDGNDNYALWSPHVGNAWIAYTHGTPNGGSLWIMDANGKNKRRLHDFGVDGRPQWSPDGSKLVFQSHQGTTGAHLWTIQPDGAARAQLTTFLPGEDIEPHWSGPSVPTVARPSPMELIAFASSRGGFSTTNWDVYVMNPDGSTPRLIVTGPHSDKAPAIAPDGGTVLFESQRSGGFEIYAIDLGPNGTAMGPVRQLTALGGGFTNGPSWTKDRRIVFGSNTTGSSDLYVANADGTNPTKLTSDPEGDGNARVSPDGQTVAFTRVIGSSFYIFTTPIGGGALTQLTTGGTENYASWSPDGASIVFTQGTPNGGEIWVMNADGGSKRRVTTGAIDHWPRFSPDGTKLIFSSPRSGGTHLWTVNLDGTGMLRLTTGAPGDDIEAHWVRP